MGFAEGGAVEDYGIVVRLGRWEVCATVVGQWLAGELGSIYKLRLAIMVSWRCRCGWVFYRGVEVWCCDIPSIFFRPS